jgi:predicted transcriptional regulator
MKNELSTEQLALLELFTEPQSAEGVKDFLKSDSETAQHEINKLKYRGLIKETKGPTYDFWELSDKGKDILNE